jgi:hypothetical protein
MLALSLLDFEKYLKSIEFECNFLRIFMNNSHLPYMTEGRENWIPEVAIFSILGNLNSIS